ncbi:SRPBCC family protein [Aureibacter tunicatorum]|uniref:SRPBCC family protein n=1 Tax=Aureibacter tunicatorum TaxID=866807 RepID=A0AAE3XMW1_9BACT|nr:SRPBCC family protein [Aureibacter tunicatorum]MDR6238868.1 hypothetical protein [Aureibacter tunicatorum]BDD05205.1 hypothetical protein AUTU_26880 [Aureibacter tunicatorum]
MIEKTAIIENSLDSIPNLTRCEQVSKDEMQGLAADLTHAVYSHDELYENFCPVHSYINCPPEKVFEYMSNPHCLAEWTYSMRELKPVDDNGLYVGREMLEEGTDIYFKVISNKEAGIVDYHCAWDQGEELWMVYLNRIVDAQLVFNKPGSVLFWQNCRHPYYDKNPHKDLAPKDRAWVGDFWDLFYAGHSIELQNLKNILEHRHANNLPIGPLTNL